MLGMVSVWTRTSPRLCAAACTTGLSTGLVSVRNALEERVVRQRVQQARHAADQRNSASSASGANTALWAPASRSRCDT